MFTLTDEEARETLAGVTGTLFVNGNFAKVLFDSDVTHSFISNIFAKSLGCHCLEIIDDEFWVWTPIGADVRITHRIPSLEVNFIEKYLSTEVYILGMKDFDVILEIDWLKTHYALLDCHHKKILFRKPREKEFIFQCPKTKSGKFLSSALRVGQRLREVA